MAGRIGQGGIVTQGLVFSVDSGNPRSFDYPYNGTNWRDLTSSSRNTTLTNGPTYNSSNGGTIVFDGVNDRAIVTGGTFNYSPGTTGEVSLEIWVYPTGPYTSYLAEPPTTNLAGLFGQGYFGASTGWGLGIYVRSSINYFVFQVRRTSTLVQTDFGVSFTNNNWYHLVGTFTRNELSRVYVNGILRSSTSSTALNGITITPDTNNAGIGGTQFYLSGCRIPIARLYNRPLSQQEVLQNFNSTRTRFGV